jgi:hypothetical protein
MWTINEKTSNVKEKFGKFLNLNTNKESALYSIISFLYDIYKENKNIISDKMKIFICSDKELVSIINSVKFIYYTKFLENNIIKLKKNSYCNVYL